ncbi:hypothetical protein Dimus_007181 [Dionaea muscipula]
MEEEVITEGMELDPKIHPLPREWEGEIGRDNLICLFMITHDRSCVKIYGIDTGQQSVYHITNFNYPMGRMRDTCVVACNSKIYFFGGETNPLGDDRKKEYPTDVYGYEMSSCGGGDQYSWRKEPHGLNSPKPHSNIVAVVKGKIFALVGNEYVVQHRFEVLDTEDDCDGSGPKWKPLPNLPVHPRRSCAALSFVVSQDSSKIYYAFASVSHVYCFDIVQERWITTFADPTGSPLPDIGIDMLLVCYLSGLAYSFLPPLEIVGDKIFLFDALRCLNDSDMDKNPYLWACDLSLTSPLPPPPSSSWQERCFGCSMIKSPSHQCPTASHQHSPARDVEYFSSSGWDSPIEEEEEESQCPDPEPVAPVADEAVDAYINRNYEDTDSDSDISSPPPKVDSNLASSPPGQPNHGPPGQANHGPSGLQFVRGFREDLGTLVDNFDKSAQRGLGGYVTSDANGKPFFIVCSPGLLTHRAEVEHTLALGSFQLAVDKDNLFSVQGLRSTHFNLEKGQLLDFWGYGQMGEVLIVPKAQTTPSNNIKEEKCNKEMQQRN